MPGAGQLNSRIDILKAFDTDDANTGETSTEYKIFHQNVPAKREDVSGGSTRRGRQVEETVRVVFRIPHIDDIKPDWRVRLRRPNNQTEDYEIVSAIDEHDRRQWLDIHCSRIE